MSSPSITRQPSSPGTVADCDAAPRSKMRRLTGVQLLASGSYVPEEVVTNEDLQQLGYDSDWIIQRTGINTRHRAPAHLATVIWLMRHRNVVWMPPESRLKTST